MPPGLDTEVQYLKGVGPKNAMLLQKLGLRTVWDVLWHFPRRYEDRRDIPPLMYLKPGRHCTAKGKLIDVKSRSIGKGRVVVQGVLSDKTGEVALTFFNQPYVGQQLQKALGRQVVAYGSVREGYRGHLELHGVEWEAIEDEDLDEFARIVPVYPLTEGVPQRVVRKAAKSAVEFFANQVADPLPTSLRSEEKLKSLAWCIHQMHLPDGDDERIEARRRLAFEEFLYLQLSLQMRRNEVKQEVGISFPVSTLGAASEPPPGALGSTLFAEPMKEGRTIWDEVHEMLPFTLTGAQRRVIDEIWEDMERPAPMNRLVQGDVGSGKTAVAACAMLAAVRCGYQAAMMAPTEILAEQHFINLHRLFDQLGIKVVLLVGKQTPTQKKKASDQAANGEAQICIGTHALIQEGVKFAKLGLAVIDEQHRFGVLQRMALRQKGTEPPDVLVMTATPIPRTLTMTVYGDLDLSVIDEMPPGRKPIKTHWKKIQDRSQVYATVRKLLDEGRQAYFVCPVIFENEKMEAQAAEDLFYRLSREEFQDKRVGLLHGQMKPFEKEEVMEKFRQHELDILVSTVVIEVGVDVPNASIMVIEDANRFGLAQLHQLRGRVGRGEQQSFCVLIADAKSEDGILRMEVLQETTDGFRIAEEDLRIRGPGDVMGTRQSGDLEFRVADLIQDSVLLERARQCAIRILQKDPGLTSPEFAGFVAKVRSKRSSEALVTVS
ncbi:MAG: ATP-dependent DNA helicase RecG [Armatimonadetes bacterium]|nr:ATP-dependent DNA helicase RecG [Armatimonadota bacterium]